MGIFSTLFGDDEAKKNTQFQNQQSGMSVTNLPAWQTAYLYPALGHTATMAAPQYYAGALSAARSPLTQAAEQMAYEQAKAGSPALRSAQDYSRNLLSGAYLNANPYLDATYDNAARRVQQNFTQSALPSIASMYSAAGRYGSGAMGRQMERAQQTLGDTLGRLATDVYGQNYARERAAMESAYAQAPAMAAADYYAPNMLAQFGQNATANDQAAIDREMQRWQFNQLAPWQAEQARLAMLAGDYGGRTTTTSGTTSGTSRETYEQPSQGLLGGLFGTALSAFGRGVGGNLGVGAGGLPFKEKNLGGFPPRLVQ